jgi:hypothetical protein
MEDGQALPEKESAIATLEAENENLKVGLETANTELETFRAERRRQEEDKKRQEMPEIQFKILQRFSTENVGGYWLSIFQLSRFIKIHPARLRFTLTSWRTLNWSRGE